MTAFLGAYPKINVRLLLSDRNLHLIEDHVDMAVRIGRLPDSSMIATRVGSMRTVVCASPRLLAAQGTPKTPRSRETALRQFRDLVAGLRLVVSDGARQKRQ